MKARVIYKTHRLGYLEVVDIEKFVNGIAFVKGMNGRGVHLAYDDVAMFDGKNFQIISIKYYYESFH